MILPSSANIVILASNYNPSIVSKEWLYQKGIFTETVRNFVHTPVFALVESEGFGLVVDEERLQITVRKVTQDSLNASASIAEKFVSILPETPYKSIGLNYRYTFPREGGSRGEEANRPSYGYSGFTESPVRFKAQEPCPYIPAAIPRWRSCYTL